jgi:hypothetical protein
MYAHHYSVTEPEGEPFLPFPSPPSTLGLATSARSTLVTTSLQSLRARGLFERYERSLPPEDAEVLLTAVAGSWLPIAATLAHYRACDALGLDVGSQLDIAMEVGDRVHGTFLGMMVRTARTVGITPWSALAQSARLYGRLFCGGGIAVTQLGPKDARVDIVGNPLCAVDYFRVGVRGIYQAALRLFCLHVLTRELRRPRMPHAMSLRIAWV